MKTFRILTLILVSLILFSACGNNKKPDPAVEKQKTNVVGSWELMDIVTKSPQIGDATIVVYLEFKEDSTFTLSQQIGEGRFKNLEGTYEVQNGILSGTYSDGTTFGTQYKVERTENILNLTTQNEAQETYIYRLR